MRALAFSQIGVLNELLNILNLLLLLTWQIGLFFHAHTTLLIYLPAVSSSSFGAHALLMPAHLAGSANPVPGSTEQVDLFLQFMTWENWSHATITFCSRSCGLLYTSFHCKVKRLRTALLGAMMGKYYKSFSRNAILIPDILFQFMCKQYSPSFPILIVVN